MLHNINSYGLSHLCDFSIFELTETCETCESFWTYSYPFLDIYLKLDKSNYTFDAEFYSRGNKYYKTSFNNLFEYQIFNEKSGYRH